MDLRNILSPSSAGEHGSSKQHLSYHANARGANTAANSETKPRRDLRSIVARRFMLMNEAHDRIRIQLLSGHSPDIE